MLSNSARLLNGKKIGPSAGQRTVGLQNCEFFTDMEMKHAPTRKGYSGRPLFEGIFGR
jgi:hypothetical protein